MRVRESNGLTKWLWWWCKEKRKLRYNGNEIIYIMKDGKTFLFIFFFVKIAVGRRVS